ncbi:tetraprenyl-beta-curcumene synthase family protein [Salimicrobium flavidum]|uniref:Tetraprenyl-beta-curcumene synthase n=1 Tax=Salimicrobium flavidum TaxID=570947 RepID=A0A1N7J451_9BACI|nr:tetraprenyl-beta-curcumene synthase family protein [Salimicrobium flavidum]SIS44094.1 tetraprenyl-beta-curcumene synthase [Salimicrobium flavidum]
MTTYAPSQPVDLMYRGYRSIFPEVFRQLDEWKRKAESIPDGELKNQACDSIERKSFHCEGGGLFSLLSGDRWKDTVTFVVAYQTICDYLDNLCDQSESLDPRDFESLHYALEDAVHPGNGHRDYYFYREEKEDGGYLDDLVDTCQNVLGHLPFYHVVHQDVADLSALYGEFQVHKHVAEEDRVERMRTWYEKNRERVPEMEWYEFSACTASTMGVYTLVAYCAGDRVNNELVRRVKDCYFPTMQGMHILLDYYIDQAEDEEDGEMNFCTYYESNDELKKRIGEFMEWTDRKIERLPDAKFHRMLREGVVSLYLADEKVKELPGASSMVPYLLNISGKRTWFFYLNVKAFHKIKA